ncbi:MAG: glycosyl hydrolase family 28-related protein [Clostridiales bacterium]|nr:glycosyl hydrolase family 28-related protein [Clostridiales bacterium]
MKHFYSIIFTVLVAVLFFSPTHICHAAGETYYYNVTDFGANGADKENDRSAIQKALDQAGADYNIEVIVPAGTYYISDTLYIQSNTTLRLDDDATIKRSFEGLEYNMLRNTDAKHKSNKGKKYNLSQNIRVTGGTWDGGDIKEAVCTSNLLYFGHAKNIIIDSTTIKNCYGAHAIELAGVCDSAINRCKISGFRYEKDKFTSEAIQLDICYKSKQDGEWAPGFATDKTPCKNISITKNMVTDYPRGFGIHHTLRGKNCKNITISYNTFNRSSSSKQGKAVAGIFLWGADNVSIKKNKFNYYSYGAIIKKSTRLSICNNVFKYNNYGALTLESCDSNNGKRNFSIINKKKLPEKTEESEKELKKLQFICSYIKSGTIKVGGKTYKFHSSKAKKTKILEENLQNKQTVKFYGKDSWGNKYYQTRTINIPNK